jgi:hypothetical protein
MPSLICCPNGHLGKGVLIRDATIALSKGESIGVCKTCGKEFEYRIEHTYANEVGEKKYIFKVTRAMRLGTRLEGENYDPFLLVVKNIESGEEQILPVFWAFDKSGTYRWGQFSPILSLEEWKSLFRQLDADFYGLEERIRVRAYQLYEQRGKRNGNDLDDWLQAEAELTERKSLRAAA